MTGIVLFRNSLVPLHGDGVNVGFKLFHIMVLRQNEEGPSMHNGRQHDFLAGRVDVDNDLRCLAAVDEDFQLQKYFQLLLF